MIYFNYTYDLCVPYTPWKWAKHTGLTSTLELVVPTVHEAGIRSLDHPVRSKSDSKFSPASWFFRACRRSWPIISLGLRWLLASSQSCLPVSPGQNGPQARTVAHEGHVSASCDAPCHSIWIWQLPCHTATSSTVNKQLQLHSELSLALTTLCLRQLCMVLGYLLETNLVTIVNCWQMSWPSFNISGFCTVMLRDSCCRVSFVLQVIT